MHLPYKKIEPYLPAIFKHLNTFMVLLWKLGLGKLINIWPAGFGSILVMRHFGRQSGEAYLTPLNYCEKGKQIYVVSGFGAQSDWYLNLMANPRMEIWLPDGWYTAQTTEIAQEEEASERLVILREVLVASGFAAPLFGIYPKSMSDEELETATRHYRLVKISRQAACTGADGPGGLAWLWPIILVAVLLKKGRRKR